MVEKELNRNEKEVYILDKIKASEKKIFRVLKVLSLYGIQI